MLYDPQKKTAMVTVRGRPVRLAWSEWPGTGQSQSWIFLHGMGSSRWAYADLLQQAPVAGHYYALDLPGFGDSSLPPFRQTLNDFQEALGRFIAHLGEPKPILVGHSFGGMVAGVFAAAHPRRVKGVILVSSAGYFPPLNALSPTRWRWINQIGLWVTSMDFFGNRMLRALGLDPHQVSPISRRRMRYGWRRAREMARMGQFYDAPDFVARLVAADIPIAAIHGDRDILFPLSDVKRLVQGAFPIFVAQGAGHLPYDYDLMTFVRLLKQAGDVVSIQKP
ncbi:hypothetical protein BXT84_02850 [Sulfobacillus thermotolerans]|uniref:AB hydrolase-1 domain-containing protein n=1 Tax=Sulfobacillus thermotolerans TaxID=338644 RepID=A0ABM6RNW4_9FIRM|nr:hypothetical protein BXT84_02850 [Sulfobacillus thermotolerans]